MTPAQFDKTLQKYFSAGQIRYFTIPTPPGIETTGYTATPVSPPDAKAIMADMHLHSPDYQAKAVEEFQEVLKAQPDNAAALRGMGYACLQKQDFEGAGSYFNKAAERDSKDPRVHYYSALLMSREGALGRDPDKLARMKKELQASIALDPSFADSYGLLAFAYMASGEHSQALESMKKALELSPRNEQYLFNLSLIYLSLRKTDDAITVLKALGGSANPEVAMQAQRSLEQAQQMKAMMERGVVIIDSQEESTGQGRPDQPTSPQMEKRPAANTDSGTITLPNVTPPAFLKGKLVSVDCSAAPVAILSVVSGGKAWKMKVADSNHVIVIGADKFSCSWTNQKVALNYRQTGENEGKVMTLEIQ
jgi:tetratricopeptide (TPR) repeat protein